jgi:hypothetical protein
MRAANFNGAVADNQLSGNIARLNAPAAFTGPVSFSNATGTFSGNASGLSNVPVNSLVRTTTNFSIVGWGHDFYGQLDIPPDLNNVAAVAAGVGHSLALKTDGTVVAWGINDFGQTNVPPGLNNVATVSAGWAHNLALKSDGTVVAWGYNEFGQANVPAGLSNVTAVAAGHSHSLALKNDRTVVAWGNDFSGQTTVPAGLSNVATVAAGYLHSLALKSDGTVVAWGWNQFGQTNVPAGLGNVAAVAAGHGHSLALKSDGTVVAWGRNDSGETTVPAGLSNVTAVAAGYTHSLALKSDGTVVGWGVSFWGLFNVPAGLRNVIAVAAGPMANHILVIRQQPYSPVAWMDADNTFDGNLQVNGTLSGNGAGLTNLSATNLSGSVPSTSLTAVPAGSLTGTIANARLSTNVALRTGGNAFSGNQTIVGTLGVGTVSPQGSLHVYSANNPTVMRIQSTAGPGFGRIEFLSNPQGDPAEWRPAYIQSTDAGNFTGGLAFFVNGTGVANTFGSTEVMRLVNGNVAIAPSSALSFGAQVRQMINLWGTTIGIGVQGSTLYSRCNSGGPNEGFAWYKGGVHNDAYANPGGGIELMHLVQAGLYVNGAVVLTSDRNAKENFAPVTSREVLEKVAAMPISRWNFKHDGTTRHIGPMAQDFHAAFGVGADDKHIATVDADGVALAAIQGLNQKLEEQRAENAELKQRLEALEKIVHNQKSN